MPAVFINVIAVLLGGAIGCLFKGAIKERYTKAVMSAIGLCVLVIGVQSALSAPGILELIVMLIIGTLLGTALRLDERMNSAGELLKKRLEGSRLGVGSIGEAFVTTSILFCVGTMTVVGSIEAGLNGDYEIIITKSIMDFVSAIAFASALGAGVLFSAVTVLVVQGSITLLAGAAAPLLTAELVNSMSAVGGTMFLAMGFNLLELGKERMKVGDMLPAIFLPLLYYPLRELLLRLF